MRNEAALTRGQGADRDSGSDDEDRTRSTAREQDSGRGGRRKQRQPAGPKPAPSGRRGSAKPAQGGGRTGKSSAHGQARRVGDQSREKSERAAREDPHRPARGRGDASGGARPRSDSAESSQAPAPHLPDNVTARDLDPQLRRELRSLPKKLADTVARHLVMADGLLADEPENAYRHATEARRRASRVGMVREACGLAAYRAGRWADALAELRAARRMTGNDAYLPIMADCERGLGRPERALAAARSAEAGRLGREASVEMRIVESGARRDLGQYDAAVLVLEDTQLRGRVPRQQAARLYYAYADALYDAGRTGEAEEWLGRAAAADDSGVTDAGERLADLDAISLVDLAGESGEAEEESVGEEEEEEAGETRDG